jgi:chorismate mutase/prephenate dehydratase
MATTDNLNAAGVTPADLSGLRQRIDALDEQIARLLQERAQVSLQVGHVKRSSGAATTEIFVPEREAAVLERVQSVPGPLNRDALAAIYREVFSTSRALQRPLRVAHLGPAATFGHQAALERFGSAVQFEPCATHAEVFTAVENGSADYGVVAVENSSNGAVGEVLDRLLDTPLQACAEVTVPIAQALVASASDLRQIQRVVSHPQALGQCTSWLARHLPGVPLEPSTSTGRAAEMAASDPTLGAIAPRMAAAVFGLNLLAENIQDLTGNVTRFLVLARSPSLLPTGDDRTLVVVSIRNRLGALRDLTGAFAAHGVDMSSIQSRPSKRRAWDYVFFIELQGHVNDPHVQQALHDAEEQTMYLKVLGSWPKPHED